MSINNKAELPTPWPEFLGELDALLSEPVQLHCIGGFVVSLFYGLPRPTGDIDYCAVFPMQCEKGLQTEAGLGSPLHKKHKVYMQHVAVNNIPEDYETRLVEMFHGQFMKLHLYALDPYDLILSKLERNSTKDRDDVAYLAKELSLDPSRLRERYIKELRPYLTNEARHDRTLNLWTETCFPAPATG
jgi:hypothetical protein